MAVRRDWITPEMSALEVDAANLLETAEARRSCKEVGALWRDHVRPDADIEALFEEEMRQAAYCAALRAVNCDPGNPSFQVIGRFPHASPGSVVIPGSNYGHGNPDTLYRLAM